MYPSRFSPARRPLTPRPLRPLPPSSSGAPSLPLRPQELVSSPFTLKVAPFSPFPQGLVPRPHFHVSPSAPTAILPAPPGLRPRPLPRARGQPHASRPYRTAGALGPVLRPQKPPGPSPGGGPAPGNPSPPLRGPGSSGLAVGGARVRGKDGYGPRCICFMSSLLLSLFFFSRRSSLAAPSASSGAARAYDVGPPAISRSGPDEGVEGQAAEDPAAAVADPEPVAEGPERPAVSGGGGGAARVGGRQRPARCTSPAPGLAGARPRRRPRLRPACAPSAPVTAARGSVFWARERERRLGASRGCRRAYLISGLPLSGRGSRRWRVRKPLTEGSRGAIEQGVEPPVPR